MIWEVFQVNLILTSQFPERYVFLFEELLKFYYSTPIPVKFIERMNGQEVDFTIGYVAT